MSNSLLRISALTAALILSGLSGTACSRQNEDGAVADGRTNANVEQASSGGAQARAETQRIEMDDDVFRPALLNVPAGTQVIWVNKGHKAHTVVSNDKLFDSGLVSVDGEFSHTFKAPGTYSYHCAPHAKMVGQIVVK